MMQNWFFHTATHRHTYRKIFALSRETKRGETRGEKRKSRWPTRWRNEAGACGVAGSNWIHFVFSAAALDLIIILIYFRGFIIMIFFSLFFFFCFFLQLFISCCSSFFVTIKYSLTQWRPIIREGTLLWFLSNLHISFHFFFAHFVIIIIFFIFTFSYFFCWCFAFFFSFLGFYFDAVEKYTVREKKNDNTGEKKKIRTRSSTLTMILAMSKYF